MARKPHPPEHIMQPARAKRTAGMTSHFANGPQHYDPNPPNPYPKPHSSGEPNVTFVTSPSLPVTRNRGKRTSPGSRTGSTSKDIQHLANNRLKRLGR